jgi:hypothetical protein
MEWQKVEARSGIEVGDEVATTDDLLWVKKPEREAVMIGIIFNKANLWEACTLEPRAISRL